MTLTTGQPSTTGDDDRPGHLRGDPPPAVGDQRRPGAGWRPACPGRRSSSRATTSTPPSSTADGRSLYTGVYILHHGATLDEFVRHVLRDVGHRRHPPGRHVLHQRSVAGCAARQRRHPRHAAVRRRGARRLVRHRHPRLDVGSPVPGSFVIGAQDRFGEAPLFPAHPDRAGTSSSRPTSSVPTCATAGRRTTTR